MNAVAVQALTMLRGQGDQREIRIISQNPIEFWSVYTRPRERNGLGRTPAEAAAAINQLKAFFPLLLDTTAIYPKWERLVTTHAIRGVNVHDARLVSAMLLHGLTFNTSDFARFSEIAAVDPASL